MKETLRRAARTFIQTAVGYITTNVVYVLSSNVNDYNYLKNAIIGLGVSAVAAGLAAAMNLPEKDNKEE